MKNENVIGKEKSTNSSNDIKLSSVDDLLVDTNGENAGGKETSTKTLTVIVGAVILSAMLGLAYLGSTFFRNQDPLKNEFSLIKSTPSPLLNRYDGKKILYIDSYHEGYEWSDGITAGVVNTLENTGVELQIYRMDTKRNVDEEFKIQAAKDAKTEIENFNPDVVIACDDNAFKYLVANYYKNADLPFVFCGVNWDVSVYDAPYKNTTGMIEVSLIVELMDSLSGYLQGERIGFISGFGLTSEKEASIYKERFGLKLIEKYPKTFEEWKEDFLELQKTSDAVIIYNNGGIEGWSDEEAEIFAIENTIIPSGSVQNHMANYSMITIAKVPEEQGEWSAQAALDIVSGVSISEIPIVQNKKGKLYLNLKIADKLNVLFEPSLIKNAEIIQ